MSNHVQLCEFLHGELQAWDDYVMSTPGSSWTHLSGWKAVIDHVYRHKEFYFWAKDGDKIKGILPLILMRTCLFDPLLVSLPFLDEGGICADDDETVVPLLHRAENLAKSLGVKTLEFRHRYCGNGIAI